MNTASLFNWAWLSMQSAEYNTFMEEADDLAIAQQIKLMNYLRKNINTEFGTKYGFASIKNYSEFAAKVPVASDTKQFQKWISLIEQGQQQVLTSEAVIRFEETSGTTGFSKLIPYTKTLQTEFQQGIATWMFALYKQNKHSFKGHAYWALSPLTKKPGFTTGGIPIGVDDDQAYFNSLTAFMLKQIMAVPANYKQITDANKFYKKTWCRLLEKPDLSFISCWSPTFLLQLHKFLLENRTFFIDWIKTSDAMSKSRKQVLTDFLKNNFTWKDLWPGLACISSWTHASASQWVNELSTLAGAVSIQPKGLLSTEGIVTIPILQNLDPVLSYRSHFYEFIDQETNNLSLAHQLTEGKYYEVIITTGGGLYRYPTNDIVEITGFYQTAPAMRFVGRKNRTSDLVGEKLNEQQVIQALSKVLSKNDEFVYNFIAAQAQAHQAQYVWAFEIKRKLNDREKIRLMEEIEMGLSENPWYAQALRSGQLLKMKAVELQQGFTANLLNKISRERNIADSNIKLPQLYKHGEIALEYD